LSAQALFENGESMLTPRTWVSDASSFERFAWKVFISCSQPPVKANT
jgi:hypothetical protein